MPADNEKHLYIPQLTNIFPELRIQMKRDFLLTSNHSTSLAEHICIEGMHRLTIHLKLLNCNYSLIRASLQISNETQDKH